MILLVSSNELKHNKDVFKTVLLDVSEEEYLWKPSREKWYLLEVVYHLYDEEREDFRARIKSTLEDTSKEWTKIDPPTWVSQRNYMGQDYGEKLSEFLNEREASLSWLQGLVTPNLNTV